MSDSQLIIQNLLVTNILRSDLTERIIQAQALPPGGRGLDAGCGIGQQASALAQATGGQVVGLDLDPAQLVYASGLLSEAILPGGAHTPDGTVTPGGAHPVRVAGRPGRIQLCAGDVTRLPFADRSLDWVWSMDCIGYPAWDLLPVLGELRRVLKPGGTVILAAWSSQQLLPGHPLLEARLNAVCSAYAPYLSSFAPGQHFLRAARWLRAAGFADVQAQTFTADVQAPLSPAQRQALLALFEMLWVAPENGAPGTGAPETVFAQTPGVSENLRGLNGDWAEFRRLCRPDSADCILDLPEYTAFFTYTLFRGRAPEPG